MQYENVVLALADTTTQQYYDCITKVFICKNILDGY